MKEAATELEFLQFFYQGADFGPADSEVREFIKKEFVRRTGKALPEGYEEEV
ncbi:hypothetical protein KAR91_17405 [Candidatus Pacearchaeota archaeon]|nr:hypothetical protein [Candidatus Pacearchaeota archaeon]